jgi:phenylacetate-CoA ligase
MTREYFDPDIECLPLGKLIELQQRNLLHADIIRSAAKSVIYRDAWQQAGIKPEALRDRGGLRGLPYINSAVIKQAYLKYNVADIVDMEHARLWSCTSGSTGTAKWIPYSDSDLEYFNQILMRNFFLQGGRGEKHCALTLTSPAPFISDALTSFGVMTQTQMPTLNEAIPVGLNDIRGVINLAQQRKADALISFPSIAMRMAEEISGSIKSEVSRRYRETGNLKYLAAKLLFSLKKPSVRDIFKLRYGIFSGESIAPYREAIRRHYGLEPFATYTFTEFPCLNIECWEHRGIHIWSDFCVPEVIPQSELEKEEACPGYIPAALFLDEAPAGMQGEYVITSFSQAFPLIRYRTADLVLVKGSDACVCGRTHPRIEVLRRLDDIINMGLIRFSIHELTMALSAVERYGSVDNWQLQMKRDGYKPLPEMHVTGKNISDAPLFINEVKEQLMSIKILKQGVDSGLVFQPVVVLEERIKDETTPTGKLKRVVYAGNW